MARRIKEDFGPNLFDVIEQEEAKVDPASCAHRREMKTLTVWPGLFGRVVDLSERMTMTCEGCGRVRGRFPRE